MPNSPLNVWVAHVVELSLDNYFMAKLTWVGIFSRRIIRLWNLPIPTQPDLYRVQSELSFSFTGTLLLTITVYIHQVPRVGGIKKGWVKQFVVVCDFKLFLYDIREERNNVTASIVVNQVLDMRSVSLHYPSSPPPNYPHWSPTKIPPSDSH